MMDYDEFKEKLKEVLEKRLFNKEDSDIYSAFDSGARTMYYAALSTFMQMEVKEMAVSEC